MKTHNYWQSKISLVFVVLLLALLPALAVLQYNWLGKVSRAERERMQTSLRLAASNFIKEFDREITFIFFSFRNALQDHDLQAEKKDSTLGQPYVEAYQKWLTNTQHPLLIKGLYFVNVSESSPEKILSKFSPQTASFQPSDWPSELTKLKENLSESCSVKETNNSKEIRFQSDTPIMADIPAIVILNTSSFSLPRVDLSNHKADVFFNKHSQKQ
ncbi:MAG: hypothetical protein FD167_2071 [bacterium]|nr:MAG: hypothetical protein FD167_2071 [bacterium]